MVVVRWNCTLPKDESGSSCSLLVIRASVDQLVLHVKASQFFLGGGHHEIQSQE